MTDRGTIVFTGGGTGGHIYPNLALANELAKRGFDVVYVGGEGDTLERRLATAAGMSYFGVPTVKFARSLSPSAIKNNARIPTALSEAVKKAKDVLKHVCPSAVFSKGGYASLPAVLAAKKLSVPIFAHESDLTLGLANKIAALSGATIMKANPKSRFKGIFVGMPLRSELFAASGFEARKKLGISDVKKPVLLALGGSSGAKFINDAIRGRLTALTQRYFVLHVVGKDETPFVIANDYLPIRYADNIADLYAASDVILSRAGATAVFEISALKKRAVFVPLPKGISRGDQIFNARLAEEYGALSLSQNANFFADLIPTLEKCRLDPPMRAICADANGKIADVICDRLVRGEKCKDKKR